MNYHIYRKLYNRKEIEKSKAYFIFGDNYKDAESGYVPSVTQAVIRGLPNAIGIPTKYDRFHTEKSFLYNGCFKYWKKDVDKILSSIPSNATVYIPVNGIGTGRAQLQSWAPKCFAYLCSLGLVYDMIMLEYNQEAQKIGISKFDPKNDKVYYSTYFEINMKDAYDVFGKYRMDFLLEDPAPMTITFKRGE